MSKNPYIIPIAIVIAGIIIAGAVLYSKNPKTDSDKNQGAGPSADLPKGESKEFSISQNSNIKGDFNAPITIVEYSDFQCPFCAKFHPTMESAIADYPDKIRWVYKHFPLDKIHLQARPAAEASECAAEQGKFWEFADGLFENQSQLGSDYYNQLASEIGLDLGQFESCVSSRKYKDKVEADYQEGRKNGVTGTPASFINGELVPGAVPYTSLKTIIEKF